MKTTNPAQDAVALVGMPALVLCIIALVASSGLAQDTIVFENNTMYNKSTTDKEHECYESAWSYAQDKVGFVIYGPERYYNICERDMNNATKLLFPPKTLVVYSCIGGEPAMEKVMCELDCMEGTCLTDEEFPAERDRCADSDGGNNPDKRGYTTSAYGRAWDVCVYQEESETERCFGDECFLSEYVCDTHGRDIVKLRIKCEYGCSGGACVPCDGCVHGGICYKLSEHLDDSFCGETGAWEPLREIGSACEQSYECDTGFCRDGTCFIECEGCWHERACVAYDTVVQDMYCDTNTSDMRKLRYIGDVCARDFECASQQCHNGICRPKCDGCYTPEWDCKPVKLRFRDQYCGTDKELHQLKDYGESCMDDYECAQGYCDRTCTSYSLWNRMMTWLRNLF